MSATPAALAALPDRFPVHAETLGAILAAASGQPAAGTMRAWMAAHNGRRVLTLQVEPDGARPWAPGPRDIDALHSTYVVLGGSRRDYAGCRVLATGSAGIIIDAGAQVIAYALADAIGGTQ